MYPWLPSCGEAQTLIAVSAGLWETQAPDGGASSQLTHLSGNSIQAEARGSTDAAPVEPARRSPESGHRFGTSWRQMVFCSQATDRRSHRA